jgi:hypothetical protein
MKILSRFFCFICFPHFCGETLCEMVRHANVFAPRPAAENQNGIFGRDTRPG